MNNAPHQNKSQVPGQTSIEMRWSVRVPQIRCHVGCPGIGPGDPKSSLQAMRVTVKPWGIGVRHPLCQNAATAGTGPSAFSLGCRHSERGQLLLCPMGRRRNPAGWLSLQRQAPGAEMGPSQCTPARGLVMLGLWLSNAEPSSHQLQGKPQLQLSCVWCNPWSA